MNYYEAKFARDAKRKPTDWVIKPPTTSRQTHELIYIGARKDEKPKRI